MATNSELLDQAMSRLGQRASTRVRADVLAEINTTMTRLERGTFLPWFLQSNKSLSIVSGESSKALDSTFLREVEETRPYYTLDGTLYYMEKRLSRAALQQDVVATSVKYYAIEGTTFYFNREADQSYSIVVPCYISQNDDLVDNSNNVLNEWLLYAHDWVVNEALSKVAAFHLHNRELSALLKGDAMQAKNELYIYHESRIHTNQDYHVGGASDGS